MAAQHTDQLHDYDRWPAVATVETDRYCDGCAYNLVTQPVRRDPRTELLVVRCPECAKLHAATNATGPLQRWLERLAVLGLLAWMVAIVALTFAFVAASIGVNMATVEELTVRRPMFASTQPAPTPPTAKALVAGPAPQLQYVGSQRTLRTDHPQPGLFLAGMGTMTALLAAGYFLLLVIALHHWPRPALLCAVLLPLIPAGVSLAIVQAEFPGLETWSLGHIGRHAAIQMACAAGMVLVGRRFARLVVRALLPPGLRQHLSFLWLADGMQPPTATPRTART